ncbi:uncharacterized protein A1O5_00644 [Cladophialophora psammophila CBS 110553]|uniref:3-oxoacyl-[acyl-carrier protein] reductase n=1 Tax=Cladophialophora psammophila CBS 110553 TaxID=1182543 RepID=W9XGQ9_9EURO|nr:uncharacterized protein A1O5_00644 [Cladophialophora psammophila CBS 110553]EXJ76136.1 hypothetical protein A1O5_00644 [Cladophialophora psammophila CBS 110553]
MPEQSLRSRFLGIGEAAVFQFAKYGAASLAISDMNLSSLEKVAQRLRDEYPHVEVEVLYIDTSDEQSIIDAHEATIRRFGRIDYAVNNAGVAGPFLPSVDTSRDQFMFGIDVNMVGVWLCQREQIKHMLKQEGLTPGHVIFSRGTIVNMSSIYGHKCARSNITYGTAKHAVLGITRNDAVNYGKEGIRINAVCPGFIETPMTRRPEGPSAGMQAYLATVPLARYGQPDEVADVILFLSSPLSRYMTGTDIMVDGGFRCV